MAKPQDKPIATDDGAWVEYDLSRYRWNLSDGDRPLRGHVVGFEKLPDGKGGLYPAIILHLTAETTAKSDKGEVVTVLPGQHVILSASEGLSGIWPTLIEMAGNPNLVHEIELKRAGTVKTAAGYNMNKVSFRHRPTGTLRSSLPHTPSYAKIGDGSDTPQLPSQIDGAMSPVGGYAG